MRDYYIQYNIGKARYVLSYTDGTKHSDGSTFYAIKIYKNKVDLNKAIKDMKAQGYTER